MVERERETRLALRLARQLEAAQQITHIGSWEWELASGALSWSDELYRIYGYPPGSCAVSFDWFLRRVHPEDRERVRRDVFDAIEGRGRFSHRERIIRPDGSVRELESVGEVVVDDQDRAVTVVGTCRDVTEERRREEAIRIYADVVDRVQIGLSVWSVDRFGDPASPRLVACNRAMELATGVALSSRLGSRVGQVFAPPIAADLGGLMAGLVGGRAFDELPAHRFGDARGAATWSVKAFRLHEGSVGLAMEDISARVRDQRLQGGERRALEMLAAGAPLPAILGVIVDLIEELEPGCVASILLLDPSGTRLRHGAAGRLPEAYLRAVDGQPIGPRAGSCGTAAFRGEPVLVSDIRTDPLWQDYPELVALLDLSACWSTPILASDRRVLGTFALYHPEARAPDAAVLDLVARATHVAGISIERRQLDDQMRALSERVEAVREDERTGIARELHDELGQALTALKLDLAWLARRIAGSPPAAGKIAEMIGTADELLLAVRRISAELRPGILDAVGLPAALEWQGEEFAARTGIECRVRSAVGDLDIDRGLATAMFRIFQEALTNVARHAGATAVEVDLRVEGGRLRLAVSDDGVGLPDIRRRSGLGLLGMRERARRLGGECVIRDREPRGTVVELDLPLRLPAGDSGSAALPGGGDRVLRHRGR